MDRDLNPQKWRSRPQTLFFSVLNSMSDGNIEKSDHTVSSSLMNSSFDNPVSLIIL